MNSSGAKGTSAGKKTPRGGRRGQSSSTSTPGSNRRDNDECRRRQVYRDYVPLQDIPSLDNIVLGNFRTLSTTRRSAYVTPMTSHDSLFVPPPLVNGDVKIEGEQDKNRCIDGDLVYVEIGRTDDDRDCSDCDDDKLTEKLEAVSLENEFSSPKPTRRTWNQLERQQSLWSPQISIDIPEAPAPLPPPPQQQCQGRVIHVIRAKSLMKIIGVVRENPKNPSTVQFFPVSNKYPIFFVPPHLVSSVSIGKLYSGMFDASSWSAFNYFPRIDKLELLGDAADIEGETVAALLGETDFRHCFFVRISLSFLLSPLPLVSHDRAFLQIMTLLGPRSFRTPSSKTCKRPSARAAQGWSGNLLPKCFLGVVTSVRKQSSPLTLQPRVI